MSSIAMPSFSCRSLRSFRICAWIVTSSAVVGSSAMSSAGSHINAMAIIARWRKPPDNSKGYMVAARTGSGNPTRPSISSVRSRSSARDTCLWIRSTSPIWLPIVWSGDSEVIGSWKIMAMRLPRNLRMSSLSRGNCAISITCPGVRGSLNRIFPRVMLPERGRMPMIVWAITDLPEPDSPTSAVTLPGLIRKLADLTASMRPPISANDTPRSSIRRRSVIEFVADNSTVLAGRVSPASPKATETLADASAPA